MMKFLNIITFLLFAYSLKAQYTLSSIDTFTYNVVSVYESSQNTEKWCVQEKTSYPEGFSTKMIPPEKYQIININNQQIKLVKNETVQYIDIKKRNLYTLFVDEGNYFLRRYNYSKEELILEKELPFFIGPIVVNVVLKPSIHFLIKGIESSTFQLFTSDFEEVMRYPYDERVYDSHIAIEDSLIFIISKTSFKSNNIQLFLYDVKNDKGFKREIVKKNPLHLYTNFIKNGKLFVSYMDRITVEKVLYTSDCSFLNESEVSIPILPDDLSVFSGENTLILRGSGSNIYFMDLLNKKTDTLNLLSHFRKTNTKLLNSTFRIIDSKLISNTEYGVLFCKQEENLEKAYSQIRFLIINTDLDIDEIEFGNKKMNNILFQRGIKMGESFYLFFDNKSKFYEKK